MDLLMVRLMVMPKDWVKRMDLDSLKVKQTVRQMEMGSQMAMGSQMEKQMEKLKDLDLPTEIQRD